MLKGHLPRVIYHQVYQYTKKESMKPFEAFFQVARGCVVLMDETEMEDSKLDVEQMWHT